MEDSTRNPQIVKQTGHQERLCGIAYHPDGKQLASTSADGIIKLWDIESNECTHTLTMVGGSDFAKLPLLYSPDGAWLVSCADDDAIEVWDTQTGQLLRSIKTDEGSIQTVTWGDDGRSLIVLLGYVDDDDTDMNTAIVWNTETNHSTVVQLDEETNFDNIPSYVLTPDAQSVMVLWNDGDIERFNVETHDCDLVLQGHEEQINDQVFSADQTMMLTGSDDCTIKLWDLETGECLRTFNGHDREIVSLVFSTDEQQFVSASHDRTTKLWDIESGKCLQTMEEHDGWVTAVAMSPDGQQIASGSDDESIKLWDAESGECVQTIEGYSLYVKSVSYNPDGTLLAAGVSWRHVDIWDIETGVRLHSLYGHDGQVTSVTFSADGEQVVSASSDNQVKIWDIKTGECLSTLDAGEEWMQHNVVCHHPMTSQIAYSANDYTICIWDTQSEVMINTLSGHSDDVIALAYSRDGTKLASSAEDETIKLWNLETGQCIRTLQCEELESASDLEFSSDGRRLVSCSYIGEVITWDCTIGVRLYSEDVASHAVVWHPHKNQYATAGLDNKVKLWAAESSEVESDWKGHTAWIQSVDYRGDGKQLASGSLDATIKLWDLETGQCAKTIYYLPDENYAVVDEVEQVFIYETQDARQYFRMH